MNGITLTCCCLSGCLLSTPQLHLLLSRVTTLHSDSVELLWEPKSLAVTQVIEPPPADIDCPPGGGKESEMGGSVSGMGMSTDAAWVMCCTTSGKLNVYFRRRSQQQISKGRGSPSSQVDAYMLNQVSRAASHCTHTYEHFYDGWYKGEGTKLMISSYCFALVNPSQCKSVPRMKSIHVLVCVWLAAITANTSWLVVMTT